MVEVNTVEELIQWGGPRGALVQLLGAKCRRIKYEPPCCLTSPLDDPLSPDHPPLDQDRISPTLSPELSPGSAPLCHLNPPRSAPLFHLNPLLHQPPLCHLTSPLDHPLCQLNPALDQSHPMLHSNDGGTVPSFKLIRGRPIMIWGGGGGKRKKSFCREKN